MIVGIGVDVCEVARWRAATQRHPGLVERVLTPTEAALPVASQAARFAAKEALVKALGVAPGARWRDVEVVRGPAGAPRVRLSGATAELAAARRVGAVHVSLSHDAGVAVAVVVCEETP